MPDFPYLPPTPLFINTLTRWSGGWELARTIGTFSVASTSWPVANLAYYIPFYLPWPYQVNRVFWLNGSSVTSVNVDLGIYNADGTLIYSTGSTARSGTSATQYVSPTPFLLSPGRYYLGHSCSSTTSNRGGLGITTPTLPRMRLAGILQEASALPLPATMTPVVAANAFFPLCGITRTESGF